MIINPAKKTFSNMSESFKLSQKHRGNQKVHFFLILHKYTIKKSIPVKPIIDNNIRKVLSEFFGEYKPEGKLGSRDR